jgi:hypothetical protein
VFAALDHRAAIMSRVNQNKSREAMRARIRLLYDWLDLNIDHYYGRLVVCAEAAVKQIDGLGMTEETVKKHISKYRKEKGLTVSLSPNKVKKKTKVAS